MRYVFPDTNVFLHYTFFTELNWCNLVGQRDVTLVVCEPVIAELDQQKNEGRSPRRRERARRVIVALEKIASGDASAPQPRDGVSVLLTAEPPPPAPTAGGYVDNDARMLAAVTVFRSAPGRNEVAVVTGDLRMKLSARAAGLPVFQPSDEMRNPDELEPLEVENRKLREQVQRLKNRLPRLAVVFANGQPKMEVTLRPPLRLSEHDLRRQLEVLREKYPVPPEEYAVPASIAGLGRMSTMSRASATRGLGFMADVVAPSHDECVQALDDYVRRYEQHLREVHRRRVAASLTFQVDLELSNVGTAAAANVDVYVGSPVPVGLTLKSPPRLPPDEPEPQKYHGSSDIARVLERHVSESLLRELEFAPLVGPMTPTEVSPNRLKLPVGKLKHGESSGLPTFHVTFPDPESVQNFELVAEVTTDSLPDAPQFRLPLIVRVVQ